MNNKIEFEKHKGFMNMSTRTVQFYNLEFKDIIQAGQVLKNYKPGNYIGWVNGDLCGLTMIDDHT